MALGPGEQEVEVVRPREVDPVQDKRNLDRRLDRLLSVKPDNIVIHRLMVRERRTRAKVAFRAPQEHAGDLELLRNRR